MNWKTNITDELFLLLEEKGSNTQEVLDSCPTEFHRLFLHGQLTCGNDQTKKAMRSFQECLTMKPNSYEVNFALGNIYLSQGKYLKSENHIRVANNINKDNFKLLMTWHYLLTRLNNKNPAITSIKSRILQHVYSTAQNIGYSLDDDAESWIFDNKKIWITALNDTAKKSYSRNKFTILKNVIPEQCFELIQLQLEKYRTTNQLSPQSNLKRECVTDMPMAVIANIRLSKLVSELVNKDVIPTYSFGIHYYSGGFIKPHVDRTQNELSMSLSLSISPSDGISPLGAGEGKNKLSVNLKPNEGLFYRGCEVIHYRDPVPENHTVNQMILGFRTINKSNCYC